MTELMRAAMHDRFGGPEVLYVREVPRPVPGPGEVLVRVRAISVNGGELAARAGRVRLVTGRKFPQRTGLDFAGEVAALASPTPDLAVGDRVWGIMPRTAGFGAAAEYVVVRPRQLARYPASLDPTAAAALPVGTTAITALRDKARLRPGERLLVRGAAGGVGNVVVQLGKARGAHVTGLARADNLDLVRGLGADEVLDYRTTSTSDLGRYDVVVDTVGADLPAYRRLLTPAGRMVTIAFDLDRVAASLGYILGSTVLGGRRVRFFSGNPKTALFTDLASYVDKGMVRPVVDTVFPLAEIGAAHAALEAGGVRGKYVVQID
ncbi:NAD(P)-dependent alcohol dehydrogenase [Streptomyces sp. SID14478]|uniref:NAD(P)-dependent alcohol dehydrogenase n=1 Tax=Streptomyces sp. SID14478 TaxID=2706073 RepID=UPI0013DA1643|nr:NAD(P)-dependent alcohol dehydrogenase [Streptomyces sp. SID14478]NEB75369.1 NAD(P)-dependent alcohol dehydrogenase [Streptomyces sp. SID14478]